MTILHLRSTRGFYGAERALLTLCEASRSAGEVAIHALAASPCLAAPLLARARQADIPAFEMLSTRSGTAVVRQVASEARRLGSRVLHAHDYKALFVALGAAALSGLPVVATFHGDTGESRRVEAYELFARALGRQCVAVATPSREQAVRLKRWISRDRCHVIPNAVRPPDERPSRMGARSLLSLEAERPVIAVVGRLSPEKGHRVLFDAVRRLPSPPCILVAGDGPLASQLQADTNDLDIRWLGFTSNPERVYAAADIVVMPSLREAMPIVALEAMDAGRPVIAAAVGELVHLLASGRGGLFPPGDATTLAALLEVWLRRPALAAEAAELARRHVQAHHSAVAHAAAYRDLLYSRALFSPSA
jgi:glycosyltransferase involved in cell wall biosynthesis